MDEQFEVPDLDPEPLKDEDFEEEMRMDKNEGVKYPDITVKLVGEDGNSFAILGAVQKALRRAGVGEEERNQFFKEATSGDRDHLLQTCMHWVNVE